MKIRINELEVIKSGSFLSYKDSSVDFVFEEFGNEFTIKLSFSRDPNIKGHTTKSKILSSDILELTLINYTKSEGNSVYLTNPLLVGTLEHHELLLGYSIETFKDDSTRNIHYTWYRGKEVKDV